MLTRIITALIGIPIAIVLIFWPGGVPFAVAIGLLAFLGGLEFYAAVRRGDTRPVTWAGLLAIILLVYAARNDSEAQTGLVLSGGLTLLLVLSFIAELIRADRSPVRNLGATVLGVVYIGWLLSVLILLRDLPGRVTIGSRSWEAGAWLVMMTFLCTWACDTLAYFIGRKYGTAKIAPSLSPGKTVEGSIAGLVGAVLVAVIVGTVIKLPAWHSLALGLLFGILAQVGDLWESGLKREMGIKDSGRIVPGHGGVLDRFDGLLLTGPAAYFYAVLFLSGWPG